MEILLGKDISNDLKEALQFTIDNWRSKETDAKENVTKIKNLLPKELDTPCCDYRKAVIKKVIELQNYFIEKSVRWRRLGL